VGQRKGIGVALGRPAFVVDLDPATSTVRLGDETDLLARTARLRDAVWSDDVVFPLEAEVRVRSRHEGARAVIDRRRSSGGADDATDEFEVRFDSPVRAVSPGQIAVAYGGDRVYGGGMIVAALREEIP
jgi:tRNA-specific 2-thiouridylase